MKSFIIILFSFFSINIIAQSDEAKSKILLVKEKLENVPPYSCDIKVKIDVSFIKIKERTVCNNLCKTDIHVARNQNQN